MAAKRQDPHSIAWHRATVLLLVTVVHLLLGYSRNYSVGPDDDRLWLYETGAELSRPELSADLNERLITSMRANGISVGMIERVEVRRDYDRNYVAASAFYRTGSEITRQWWRQPTVENYPDFLAHAMVTGFGLVYAATSIGVMVAALAAGPRMLLAVALAISSIGGLEALFDLAGDTFVGLPHLMPKVDEPEKSPIGEFIRGVSAMLLNPQIGFSMFGDTPRNHFLLLSMAVFALRWSGRRLLSYAILLPIALLHQSQTGLLTAALLGADLILRPEMFARWPARILVTSLLVMFAVRETLGVILQLAPILIVSLLAVAVPIAWAHRGGIYRLLPQRFSARASATRDRLLMRGDIVADLIVLAMIWLAIHLATYVGNQYTTPIQSNYFWAQASGRLLAILRPGLFLAFTLWLIDQLEWIHRPGLMVSVCAMLLIPGLLLVSRYDRHPISTLALKARALDTQIGGTVDWSTIGASPESVIYYSLARTLDLSRR